MGIKTQLPKVGISRRCGAIDANLGGYRSFMSDEEYEELTALAKSLQGVKICHVNSTAAGGGVAELLAAEGIVMPILHLGLPDEFQHHASREDLLAEAGLDAAGIRASILARWPQLAQPASAVRSA